VVVGLLTAGGTVSGMGVEGVGAVVGSRGPVVGVDADLVAGSAWTAGSTRVGARRGGDGLGGQQGRRGHQGGQDGGGKPEGNQP
jgi:hypothetical protein